MAFRFFLIPILAPEGPTAELNTFLGSHRIVTVERRWIEQGASSLWSLCVEYLPGGAEPAASTRPQQPFRGKTDYKDVMSPADFAVFATLREVRKAIAQADAVPVYTIFTNEQLAKMVTGRATTRAALAKIDGVGDARVEKYGRRMLEILATAWPEGAAGHEAGGPPVRVDPGPEQPADGDVESGPG